VNAAVVLAVVGVVQLVFLALLLAFVLVRRKYDRERRAAFVAARDALAAPLRDWIVAGAHPEPLVNALRALPRCTCMPTRPQRRRPLPRPWSTTPAATRSAAFRPVRTSC